MLYENILKNVSKCITLTAEETEQFTGLLTAKKVPKKNDAIGRRGNLSV
jgi:hypothetical protein